MMGKGRRENGLGTRKYKGRREGMKGKKEMVGRRKQMRKGNKRRKRSRIFFFLLYLK